MLVVFGILSICFMISLLSQDFPCRNIRSIFLNQQAKISGNGFIIEELTTKDYYCGSMGIARVSYTVYYPEFFILFAFISLYLSVTRLLKQREVSYKFSLQSERARLVFEFTLLLIAYFSLWEFMVYKISY